MLSLSRACGRGSRPSFLPPPSSLRASSLSSFMPRPLRHFTKYPPALLSMSPTHLSHEKVKDDRDFGSPLQPSGSPVLRPALVGGRHAHHLVQCWRQVLLAMPRYVRIQLVFLPKQPLLCCVVSCRVVLCWYFQLCCVVLCWCVVGLGFWSVGRSVE